MVKDNPPTLLVKPRSWLSSLVSIVYYREQEGYHKKDQLTIVACTREVNGFVLWTAYNQDSGSNKVRIYTHFFWHRERAMEICVWRYKQMLRQEET